METLLLGPDDVEESAQIGEIISAVEDAFRAYAVGNAQMPAKSYIDLPQYDGDFRSMPAYLDADGWEAASVKWVNSHTHNPERHGLPTVMGTVIYSDPETAFPLAVMDGTTLTMLRTGAAAAVATDYLAREDATSLGLVGAGVQSHLQLEAIAQVRDIETVVVADRDEDAIAEFFDLYGDAYDVREGSIEEAAACDVVSTTTPVHDPIVHAVGEGTHVNAMGADAEGKHEIADDVLQTATLVIDNYEQCMHSGEINVPWAAGKLDDEDIHAELGAIVAGEVTGRSADDEVTVFDSTGLAIQDVAAAHVVYEHADERGIGQPFELVGTDT
ncbi:ornithine cyclodeaminase family protein [Haloarculaceae archaeon H-GB2-1]|nr:ornithine cyclodeaminase family protein [Haloarculaceae archaeon H-GB1-1]MEA5388872.1 ornithine cyclodeaminase family protein [Haloarculaceae archaeon H-GB11]MEA5406926.1 ornithine cyclodeaminase family protein [Haloarculaceae archaeon H-GB2-1]